MSSSTWRVLSGYATYQRTPMRMTSWGKWAPLKLIAIVLLPHDGPLVMEGDHTANGLKGKLATKPVTEPVHVLVLGDFADELSTMGAQAREDVLDVVDGEHDTTEAQRVHRRVLRLSPDRRWRVELGQLK